MQLFSFFLVLTVKVFGMLKNFGRSHWCLSGSKLDHQLIWQRPADIALNHLGNEVMMWTAGKVQEELQRQSSSRTSGLFGLVRVRISRSGSCRLCEIWHKELVSLGIGLAMNTDAPPNGPIRGESPWNFPSSEYNSLNWAKVLPGISGTNRVSHKIFGIPLVVDRSLKWTLDLWDGSGDGQNSLTNSKFIAVEIVGMVLVVNRIPHNGLFLVYNCWI